MTIQQFCERIAFCKASPKWSVFGRHSMYIDCDELEVLKKTEEFQRIAVFDNRYCYPQSKYYLATVDEVDLFDSKAIEDPEFCFFYC